MAGGVVEHHVVDLRIVVRHALGQEATLLRRQQHINHRLTAQHKLDLRLHRCGTVPGVRHDGTLQGAENVEGPYVDIPGATSPYCVPATDPRKFFRVRP